MLRGFRKPKFFTKCKSDIKITKLRLQTIKKKRNAVQRYLKNDIAELLRSDLDINAYGRAEGLLVEQNMSACYELTETFIECIANHLSLMSNQGECPEECKEAVPSLIYAAARFADLPELRDLRNMFTEKYGNSLEPFLNKEFVERLRSKPLTKEMKIQLMHDIAQEYSIEWDSKALEQKLFTRPQPDQGSPSDSDDDVHKSHKRKDNAFHASKDAYDRPKLHSSSEDESTTDISLDAPKSSSSIGSISGDEADHKMPFYSKFVPPPYYKPKPEKKESSFEEATKLNIHFEKETDHPGDASVGEDTTKPSSVRRRNLKPPPGRENLGKDDRTRQGNDSDPRDEEERIMDGLLLHYSKKQSPYESSQTQGNLKPCLNQEDDDTGESTRRRSRTSQRDAPSARASSVPPEPTTPIHDEPKRHGRANSLQQDAHVHPKLPDYDGLAARIAALRGI